MTTAKRTGPVVFAILLLLVTILVTSSGPVLGFAHLGSNSATESRMQTQPTVSRWAPGVPVEVPVTHLRESNVATRTPIRSVHPDQSGKELGILATVAAGSSPTSSLVDPVTGDVYVLDRQGSEVYVLNGTSLIREVAVGNYPTDAAFNARNGYVYVVDSTSGNNSANVTIINGTRVVTNVSVGPAPRNIAYDPADGYLYVADSGDRSMSILNGTSLLATVPIARSGSSTPDAVVYDPSDGDVYVTVLFDGGQVAVLNGTTLVANLTLPEGSFPMALDYAPSDGDVYVVDLGRDNVSVLNGTSVLANVSVGHWPDAAVYDSGSGSVYVLNGGSQNLSVVRGSSVVGTIPLPENPSTGTYDASDGDLFITSNASEVAVVNTTSVVDIVPIASLSQGAVYDPANSLVYVMDTTADEVSILGYGTFYNVTFNETGVPPGLSWEITLGGESDTTNLTSISFPMTNGSYSYTINGVFSGRNHSSLLRWNETPVPYNGTIAVNGSGVIEPTLHFRVSVVYQVYFFESGLPLGTSWSVTLNGTLRSSTGDSVNFTVPAGIYAYQIGRVRNFSQATLPATGNIPVPGENNSNVYEPTLLFETSAVAVYFHEVGLPTGTAWWVTLNGSRNTSTTSEIGFGVERGNYSYSIGGAVGFHQSTLPSNGFLNLSSSNSTVRFEPTLYYVPIPYVAVVSESGLPAGVNFSFTVDDITKNLTTTGTSDSLTFTGLPNGTYPYSLTSVPGWNQTTIAHSGRLTVDGGSAVTDGTGAGYSVDLEFNQVRYYVGWTEVGLPVGTTWGVTMGSTEKSETAFPTNINGLVFELPNGTYTWTILNVPGWREMTDGYSGLLGVDGSSSSPFVLYFTQVVYPVTFTETGIPSGTNWSVDLGSTILNSTTNSITFEEPNGTLGYTVNAVSGFTTSRSSGAVGISGKGSTVAIGFSSRAAPVLPTWVVPAAAGIGIGVVVGGLVAAAFWRKSATSAPPRSPLPESPPKGQ